MFAKYQISIETVQGLLDRRKPLKDRSVIGNNKKVITESLKRAFTPIDGVINGDSLKQNFFPTETKKVFNVFISHSHDDVDIAEKFAKWLESNFLVSCFVDSMVWKNMADLQMLVDRNLPKNEKGRYRYTDVLKSSAHVHSMLSLSLFEMIDQCECCIFIGSKNSLRLNLHEINNETLSPWIYQEIFYMNHAKPITPQHVEDLLKNPSITKACESQINDAAISHSVNLQDFITLVPRHFSFDSRIEMNDGEAFLELLYLKTKVLNYNDIIYG